MLFVMAYVFAGLQSIFYAIIMEWRFSQGLDPRGWRSISLSTLLGLMSGAAICLAYGFDRSDTRTLWLFFGGIGLVVGFLMGVLIRMLSNRVSVGSP